MTGNEVADVILGVAREIFTFQGWMVVMFTLTLCGVVVLVQIHGLLRRILGELEYRRSPGEPEDLPRISNMDVRLG